MGFDNLIKIIEYSIIKTENKYKLKKSCFKSKLSNWFKS